ncbi:MAG: FAD-binding oxidoreductase [Verrucomicrobia bacterium]|nr:FAD-binding oxidoreductase [Verrucomicrobiota bacterium]
MSLLAYSPDDMVVTVTADTTLAALQEQLKQHGQWLPMDPPNAERTTFGEIINNDLSGPWRYGRGTVRDHLLAIRVEMADGKFIKAGAPVVKTAAGYDLCRLYVGSRGELGTVREATFKVQPVPEAEEFVEARFSALKDACDFVEKVDTSILTPVVLDLHNGPWNVGGASAPRPLAFTVVIGFAGVREEVEWQRQEAAKLAPLTASSLDHDKRFWSMPADVGPTRKISVLPSKLFDALKDLSVPFVARAGNGVIHYRGGPETPKQDLPTKLMQRLKDEFDPSHKLPARQA